MALSRVGGNPRFAAARAQRFRCRRTAIMFSTCAVVVVFALTSVVSLVTEYSGVDFVDHTRSWRRIDSEEIGFERHGHGALSRDVQDDDFLISEDGHVCVEAEHNYSFGRTGSKGVDVFIRFLIVLYLFFGIAIVCDDFFEGSLEHLSEHFNLSEDVAGATFMAAGSSAPELFTSLVAVLHPVKREETKTIGIGTIVGSAVFNILIIIGATALLAGNVLHLNWQPLVRDCGFYSMAIIALILVVNDEVVHWWEGLILTIAYSTYILWMALNMTRKLFGEFGNKTEDEDSKELDDIDPKKAGDDNEESRLKENGDTKKDLPPVKVNKSPPPEGGVSSYEAEKPDLESPTKPPLASAAFDDKGDGEGEEEEGYWEFDAGDSTIEKTIYYISFPFHVLFRLTIPRTDHPKSEKYFFLSFFMCLVWICLICYVMVTAVEEIGALINLSPSVMGLTVLAAGTSVPDAIASILVGREGKGDMAVSNALGSNIFDILLGLGFPWFLAGLIFGDTEFCVSGILTYVIILFGIEFSLIGVFMAFKWVLYPKTGYVLLSIYVVFVVVCILIDKGVILKGQGCADECH